MQTLEFPMTAADMRKIVERCKNMHFKNWYSSNWFIFLVSESIIFTWVWITWESEFRCSQSNFFSLVLYLSVSRCISLYICNLNWHEVYLLDIIVYVTDKNYILLDRHYLPYDFLMVTWEWIIWESEFCWSQSIFLFTGALSLWISLYISIYLCISLYISVYLCNLNWLEVRTDEMYVCNKS